MHVHVQVFPRDDEAKAGIGYRVELKPGCTTDVYLAKLRAALIATTQVST